MDWRTGLEYTKRHAGIYMLHGIGLLKVQVIMTEEIDGQVFKWLPALTDKLTETSARKLVRAAYGLIDNEDRQLADTVMQVLLSANGKVFEKIKEDSTMSEALMELMRPEVEKYADAVPDYRHPSYTRHLLGDIIMIVFFAVHINPKEHLPLPPPADAL